MAKKNVVIIGAGPCGLVALKEMLEAGHTAVALEKGPGIGGVFSRTHDTQYENLYLTISNMLMSFSDFPPEDLRIKYSSGAEYGDYLEAYADHFRLRPHIRLQTQVTRAAHEGGRWRITTTNAATFSTEVLEADALIVATGSNQIPRTIELPGFTGRIVHSSDYRSAKDFAGQRVLVVGSGESAFDIATDVSGVAAATTVWARTPIAPAPRFPLMISFDGKHDELAVMKDPSYPSRARVSDFLEVMTTSRMANEAPMWAYSFIRHAIFAATRGGFRAARKLSHWNRQNMKGHALLGDQISVPTKSARLCKAAADGTLRAIIAKGVRFDGPQATFTDVLDAGDGSPGGAETRLDQVDAVILCTGFRTDFSWLAVDGLDWSPRSWFKHCFPAGHGDKLMFLGWARPHQGGIPACAEILARYIAMVLDGTRTLPADYAERAVREGRDEEAFYLHARHSLNLVDYPAFMDSVARLVGCLPEPPSATRPARRIQYWMYPNWPFWYRQRGPGARPELVEKILDAFPLSRSYLPNPFILMALAFSLMQATVGRLMPRRPGVDEAWALKSKKHLLHGNGSFEAP